MFAWLGVKSFFGMARWVWVAGAVVALIVAVWAAKRADDARNQDIGRQLERAENLEEIINRTEQGNEERNEVEREAAAGRGQRLYDQCLRTARTPANCERFLPEHATD